MENMESYWVKLFKYVSEFKFPHICLKHIEEHELIVAENWEALMTSQSAKKTPKNNQNNKV